MADQQRQRIHPMEVEAPPPPPPRGSSISEKGAEKRSCFCKFMCWTLSCLLILIIVLAATAGALYLIFKPKLPNYSVDTLRISDLRLNLDMSLYAKFDVRITATNPNDKIGIYYEKGGKLSVSYSNTKLCEGPLPEFYQGHRNRTLLDVSLSGQAQSGSTLMAALQQQAGRVPLDLEVRAPVAVKVGGLKLKRVKVLGGCQLVVDSLTSNNLITIKASNCRFRMKL